MEGSEPEDGGFRRHIRLHRPDLAPEDVRRVFPGCYLCELAGMFAFGKKTRASSPE